MLLLLDEENSLHVVVNCGEALLKNNTYWPLVSDFINILSHQSVAKKFLEDHRLLVTWMNFVSFFQGMWCFHWLYTLFLIREAVWQNILKHMEAVYNDNFFKSLVTDIEINWNYLINEVNCLLQLEQYSNCCKITCTEHGLQRD